MIHLKPSTYFMHLSKNTHVFEVIVLVPSEFFYSQLNSKYSFSFRVGIGGKHVARQTVQHGFHRPWVNRVRRIIGSRRIHGTQRLCRYSSENSQPNQKYVHAKFFHKNYMIEFYLLSPHIEIWLYPYGETIIQSPCVFFYVK